MSDHQEVRYFLGLVGYYRDHIPFQPSPRYLGATVRPPQERKVQEYSLQWNEAQEHAYSPFKEYLLQEPVLKLPDT